ncbi:transcriptional regulator, LysR family [Serratia sp. AS12]|uniref:LysR family transcriptional regulator n=1 Tax=Serratia TaxID=613 RepID=UPI00020E9B5D|nr:MULTISPECIES: LysR family transcriptional regulator [Serratia]AEF45452.1 transcriptional regulator, LysR family [Serratia plymuthica AS9]AEF50403.1 transcriptional regulator, LysR family [Serratia sp. AS12]AEG28110.1 transcriptional regulator, LysR family [Serratia sp. AS13]UTN98921.1 LysR family transcriptional regulator [Serratia plymuthica]
MDNLAGVSAFVQSAETLSFVEAGRVLGVSASAIGKSIARLEARLGVRLFHRSTRSMTLTAEGTLFLQRCQRILGEMAAAEQELSDTRSAPRGKLRVSLPLVGSLLNPVLAEFIRQYPQIELEVDFSDRRVEVIEEGFDAVIRVGETEDSRLMSRQLGTFHLQLVAAPDYLRQAGIPQQPTDLRQHACLLYKFPTTGKVESWPVADWDKILGEGLRASVVCNTVDTLIYLAEQGQGIACLPDFAVQQALAGQRLQQVLGEHSHHTGSFKILWPSSKHLAPRLRVFIDLLSERLFPA